MAVAALPRLWATAAQMGEPYRARCLGSRCLPAFEQGDIEFAGPLSDDCTGNGHHLGIEVALGAAEL